MNFIIIHGVYNNPEGNWFPRLKKELEKRGYECIVPKFPTPFDQTLESWMRIIANYESKINEETVLIGHSLGAAFILDYLEQSHKKIKAAFLVAGFHKLPGNEYDESMRTFVGKGLDWGKIKSNCKKFFVICSDNDEYIRLETSKELAEKLGVNPCIIHNGKHLNKEAGYTEFPFLLELISKINNA